MNLNSLFSRSLKVTNILVFLILFTTSMVQAQCAMCRTQLENNISNGNPGIAAGINTGILYLLSMPYLIVITLGYFWYKSSRKNVSTQLPDSVA